MAALPPLPPEAAALVNRSVLREASANLSAVAADRDAAQALLSAAAHALEHERQRAKAAAARAIDMENRGRPVSDADLDAVKLRDEPLLLHRIEMRRGIAQRAEIRLRAAERDLVVARNQAWLLVARLGIERRIAAAHQADLVRGGPGRIEDRTRVAAARSAMAAATLLIEHVQLESTLLAGVNLWDNVSGAHEADAWRRISARFGALPIAAE